MIGGVSGVRGLGEARSPDEPVGLKRDFVGPVSLALSVGAGITARSKDKMQALSKLAAAAQSSLHGSSIYQVSVEEARERVRSLLKGVQPGSYEWHRLQTALQIRYKNFDLADLESATFEARLPSDPWDDVDPVSLAITLTRGERPMLGPQFLTASPEHILLPPMPQQQPRPLMPPEVVSPDGDTSDDGGAPRTPNADVSRTLDIGRVGTLPVGDPNKTAVPADTFVMWLHNLAGTYEIPYRKAYFNDGGRASEGVAWTPTLPMWGLSSLDMSSKEGALMTPYSQTSLPITRLSVSLDGDRFKAIYRDTSERNHEVVVSVPPEASDLPGKLQGRRLQALPVVVSLKFTAPRTDKTKKAGDTLVAYAMDAQEQIFITIKSFLDTHKDVRMRLEPVMFTTQDGKRVYTIAPVLVGKDASGRQVKRYFMTGAEIQGHRVPFIWAYTLAVTDKNGVIESDKEADGLKTYHEQLLRLLGFSESAVNEITKSIKSGQKYDLTLRVIKEQEQKEFGSGRERIPVPVLLREGE